MAENTKIEWTDSTFNAWLGCTKVSPGCDHCYAESWSKRTGQVVWGAHGDRKRTSPAYWKQPVKWQASAAAFSQEHGHRHRVFCSSLADVFDNKADPQWRSDLFDLIRATPGLDWLLLTKRPQNIARFLPPDWGNGYPNVWLGMTAEDQERFDQRWHHLEAVPAVVRFISYEPALGGIDLGLAHPDWVITGGESGPGARVCEPQWFRSMRDQCTARGIAFFHKQWGTWKSNPLLFEQSFDMQEATTYDTFGKGGGLLDGRLWREFPTARSVPFEHEPGVHHLLASRQAGLPALFD